MSLILSYLTLAKREIYRAAQNMRQPTPYSTPLDHEEEAECERCEDTGIIALSVDSTLATSGEITPGGVAENRVGGIELLFIAGMN